MAVTKETHPYEFLARWDENTGKFRAYHFKTITIVKDGDEVVGVKESGALNVQMAQAAGFPINDILTALHTDALKAVDDANVEKAAAVAEKEKAVADAAKVQEHLDTILGKVRKP